MDERDIEICLSVAAKEVGVKIKSLQRRPFSNVWHIDVVGRDEQIRFEPRPDVSPEECARKFKNLLGFWDYSHPSFIEDQINLLRIHSPNDIVAAMERLQRCGEIAVEPLIKALLDEDEPKVFRARVADTLGQIGSHKATEPLVAMLSDPDIVLRWHAVKALEQTGDERAISPLERVAAIETGVVCVTPTLQVSVREDAQEAIKAIKEGRR